MASAIPQRFVVVEGPIGVGKTSLVRRLGESLGGQLVLEQAEQNPFLERFYKNPRAAAFQTQLFFLFQRARQLEEVRQEDLFGAVRVADYLLEKDRLFARVTLDDAEYALYERVYERVVVDAPKPDLVVYLQAPVDVLMDRIAKRGIRYEQHIERSYLDKLTYVPHTSGALPQWPPAFTQPTSADPIDGNWSCVQDPRITLTPAVQDQTSGYLTGILGTVGGSVNLAGFTDTGAGAAGLRLQGLTVSALLPDGNMVVAIAGSLNLATDTLTMSWLESNGTAADSTYVQTRLRGLNFRRV